MYLKEALDKILLEKGYIRVEVNIDWHGIVREKYKDIHKNRKNLTILDRRCPKAIDMVKKHIESETVIIPEIEPILIHCGREIAGREDLIDKKKVITTPCKSLADLGNELNLEDTTFISWNEFLEILNLDEEIQRKILDESPIPPGYFSGFGSKIKSISGEDNIKDYFENGLHKKDELVEMLYCNNGCNNGDGVLLVNG